MNGRAGQKITLASIEKDFVQMIERMVLKAAVLEPLFGTGKTGPGEFGLIGGGIQSAIGGGSGFSLSSVFGKLFHDGGVVGSGGAGRMVSASTFAGAVRYHEGGIAGLLPGEVPAILQQGETVIPRGGNAPGGGTTHIWNIQTPDVQSFKQSQSQLAALVSRTVAQGNRNFLMRLNLGSLSGLRSAIAEAIRPRAAAGSASFVQGWEALAYGSIYPSATGIDVNPSSALRCAPVYAAIKVISESFAQIPLFMHEKDEKGSLGRVLKHPLSELLQDMPNSQQTMFEMRQQMLMWLLTWGNAFCWIVRDYRGRVAELWPIRPEWVAITFDPKFPLQPLYIVTAPDNTSHQLRRGDILHWKTFGVQPYKGDSPVLLNRETIAGWLVMEQHLSHLFGRGAKPSGVPRNAAAFDA